MWVAFFNAKATHIFAAKISIFNVSENTLATTVNKFVINELVKLTMLWTIGPSFLCNNYVILNNKFTTYMQKKKNILNINLHLLSFLAKSENHQTVFMTFYMDSDFIQQYLNIVVKRPIKG